MNPSGQGGPCHGRARRDFFDGLLRARTTAPATRLPLVAVVLVSWAASSSAWQRSSEEHSRDAPTSEGTLDNDVFVPIAEVAARALAEGDQALERARAALASGATAENARLLDAALDQWREALSAGGTGASTWFDPTPFVPTPIDLDPSAERRFSEGLRAGLVRRLASLSVDERARWKERLAPSAEQAWRALHPVYPLDQRAARLAEIVRLFPLTPAALRATLELGDLALEAGLTARARGWFARGQREAELCGEPSVLAALERRRTSLAPTEAEGTEAWHTAAGCDFADSFTWNDAGRRAREVSTPQERRPRPGGAFLEDGRFALQTASELILLSLTGAGDLEPEARLRPADFLGGYAPEPVLVAPGEPPGWPFLPLVDGQRLVLVVGRTQPAEPNALLALEIDARKPHQALGLELGRTQPAARLAWAVVGAERLESQRVVPIPELEKLGDYEFQPGPIAIGDLIVVQARQFDGQVRAWLLAFDRRDGSLAWARWLASGADRIPTQRFAESTKRVAGQPLLALEAEGEGLVFVGTHLGLGVLFDALQGEPLWSFRNRRRAEHDPGWGGERPALGMDASGAPIVLWAPMDSDRLYTLRPLPLRPCGDASGLVLVGAPAPLSQALTLLGGDAEEHLVLDGAGPVRSLSARRPGSDRVDSLALGQDERFRGLGLVSPQRVWVSTNRALYLFDRARELYLLDREALPPAGGALPGGDLQARGAHVLVLGSNALWSFLAR